MVLQWIYSTISLDLLNTIMEKEYTAMASRKRLADLLDRAAQHRINSLFLFLFQHVNSRRANISSSPDMSSTAATSVSSAKLDFHPALAVTNIKNSIPFVLKMEKDHYTMWAELFEVHARAHKVLDHIIPQPGKENPASTDASFELWTTLDSTVLQWIYSTISLDLLTTIMEKGLWRKDPLPGNVWLISLRTIKTLMQLPLNKIFHPLAWKIFLTFLPIASVSNNSLIS